MALEDKYTEKKSLVVGENDLLTWCKEHKEQGEAIIKEWDKERNGSMQKYKAGSNKMVYWTCSICGKTYAKSVRSRVAGTLHGPCGRKLGIQKLRQWHRDKMTFERSLAGKYPELLKEWDYKSNRELGFEPEYLSAYSAKKVHWICKNCGEKWESVIRLRTKFGYGCKKCK